MTDDLRSAPDPSVIRLAYRKRKLGQKLSPEERQALAAQQKEYAERRFMVYFESDEQLATWQARAKELGYTSFSTWVTDQIQRAQRGDMVDPVAHGRLEERLQRLQEDVQYERKKSQELEAENREFRAEIRRLAAQIFELSQIISDKLGKVPPNLKGRQTKLKETR